MKKIPLGNGKELEVKEVELNQAELLFDPQNPRVYSVLNMTKDEAPDQREIQSYMIRQEHVKKLKQSIEKTGLMDPVFVRRNIVVEGNCRLAAYRMLVVKDPIKWGLIRAYVLPDDTDDNAIFILLGQYHIIGRKDWNPFEQAGYLYRRQQESKKPIDAIAEELGLKSSEVKKFLSVYTTMVDNNDLSAYKWSHYLELSKIENKIKKREKTIPDLDFTDFLKKQIKENEIENAQDFRKIGTILTTEGKVAKKAIVDYKEGKCSLEDACERVDSTGKTDSLYKKSQSFRDMIVDADIEQEIAQNEQLKYTLRKIYKKLEKTFGGK